MAEIRSPLGLGVTVAGGAIMTVSAFLPAFEPKGFRNIVGNTLAQQGYWWVIAFGLAVAVTAYLADVGEHPKWWYNPMAISVLAGIYLIAIATDKDARTMYPVKLDGTPDSTAPGVVVDLGVAVYVYGVGIVVAFVGALIIRNSMKESADGPPGTFAAKCVRCNAIQNVSVNAQSYECWQCHYVETFG